MKNRVIQKAPSNKEMVGGQSLPKISRMLFKLFEQLYHDRINLEKETWTGFLSRITRVTTLQYFCCNEICHILHSNNLSHVAQPVNTLFYGFKVCLELMATHFTRNINIQPDQKGTPDGYCGQGEKTLNFDEYMKKRKMDREQDKIKMASTECSSLRNITTETDFNFGNLEDEQERIKNEEAKKQVFESKVDHILYQVDVNPKQKCDLRNEDPMVLLEVALRLYSEIRKENEGMINDLNNYLKLSMRRNSVPYGTTVGLQLEGCLKFFRSAVNSEPPPNEILSENALLEFYNNFNETERSLIHNLDIAQHDLVIKAVKISRSMRPLSKDVALMTHESAAGLDTRIAQAWEEGKKKGQEETEEELKKRYESGNSLVAELNKEIKNKKLEQGVQRSTISDLQDEIVKLNHKIKEFESFKDKNNETLKDVNENLSLYKNKSDSLDKELNFRADKAMNLANDAQRGQIQAQNIVKKIHDDKWILENLGNTLDKDPISGISKCLAIIDKHVEEQNKVNKLPMFHSRDLSKVKEEIPDQDEDGVVRSTSKTIISLDGYQDENYSQKNTSDGRSKITSAGMQSKMNLQSKSLIPSNKEIGNKLNDKDEKKKNYTHQSRTKLEVKTSPSEIQKSAKVSPREGPSKIDFPQKTENIATDKNKVPENKSTRIIESEINSVDLRIKSSKANESNLKENVSLKKLEKDEKLKEKIKKNKDLKEKKDQKQKKETPVTTNREENTLNVNDYDTKNTRRNSKSIQKSDRSIRKSNRDIKTSDNAISYQTSPKESRPATKSEVTKNSQSSLRPQVTTKSNFKDKLEHEALELLLTHDVKRQTFDFIKKEMNEKKLQLLLKVVQKLSLSKRDTDVMYLDDLLEGKSDNGKNLGSSTRITNNYDRSSENRFKNNTLQEWSEVNSFKNVGSDLIVLSEEKYEDEPELPLRHIGTTNKIQNVFKSIDNTKPIKPENIPTDQGKSKDKFRINTDLSHRDFSKPKVIKTNSTKDVRENADQLIINKGVGSPINSETFPDTKDLFKKKMAGNSTTRTAELPNNRFYQTARDSFPKPNVLDTKDRMSTVENDSEVNSQSNKFNLTGQSFNRPRIVPNSKKWFTPTHLESNRVFRSIQEFHTVGDGGLHELIHDRLNPFICGRAKNMTFVKDLFEVLKPTQVLKLTKKGVITRNIDKNAFDSFNSEFNDFLKIHMSCGPHCKHLMKFYQKIGFFKTMKQYNNKASQQLPILDFDKTYAGEVDKSMKATEGFNTTRERRPKQPMALKKNNESQSQFPF